MSSYSSYSSYNSSPETNYPPPSPVPNYSPTSPVFSPPSASNNSHDNPEDRDIFEALGFVVDEWEESNIQEYGCFLHDVIEAIRIAMINYDDTAFLSKSLTTTSKSTIRRLRKDLKGLGTNIKMSCRYIADSVHITLKIGND